MRLTKSQSFLSFFLNLLNYLQSFVGGLLLLYSLWMLTDWNRHRQIDDHSVPWFVYTMMGVGVLLCLTAIGGIVAAGSVNRPCLYLYAICVSILILLEAALLTDLAFNKHWEEELPHDATGDLKDLHAFIEENLDIFRWVVAIVVGFQALSLLLATILRGSVYPDRVNGDNVGSNALRNPLLTHVVPDSASTSLDNTVVQTDAWSSQMKQKDFLQVHRPHQQPLDSTTMVSQRSRFNLRSSNCISRQRSKGLVPSSSSDIQRKCSIL